MASGYCRLRYCMADADSAWPGCHRGRPYLLGRCRSPRPIPSAMERAPAALAYRVAVGAGFRDRVRLLCGGHLDSGLGPQALGTLVCRWVPWWLDSLRDWLSPGPAPPGHWYGRAERGGWGGIRAGWARLTTLWPLKSRDKRSPPKT